MGMIPADHETRRDIGIGAGLLMTLSGIAMWSIPLALIVGGVAIVAVIYWSEKNAPSGTEKRG